ncbi:MAG: toll/interleukin-1 receptor domain-containing protein [Turicibacter sp.]|nr:toll/interleukin-1 receptor domain-containing protein [Turicibacter sp.]
MFDFFISHSSADKKLIVDNLVTTLQNMGYKVWYDKNEILAGDDILSFVKKGLSSSYCIILVLTDNFVNSKWVFYETGVFDAKNNGRIIPLLYNISESNKNTVLNIIGNRKYLDMDSVTNEEAVSNLVKVLSRTQKENVDLHTVNILYDIVKKLASYETVNSEIISIKLKEYLNLLENQKEYLILSAKQIVRIVSLDLLEMQNKNTIIDNIDNINLLELLKKCSVGSINFREYVEFIISQDSEKNAYDYIPIVNKALCNVLTYYIHTKYPISLSFTQIEVAFSDELSYNDFKDMFEIDKKVMRGDLIADIETAYGWFKYNKYTHIGVRDINTKRIVGYFSALPVTDETYHKIVSGDFEDKDFTSDDIEQYIFSDFYRVYIAGVGIDPEYQNTGAFIKLYNALIDLFISLAKNGEIYISEILAEASTKQGEKFCKMVGMKKISSTNNDTYVYQLITIPPEFKLKNQKGKELHNLCQQKFEEYRDYFENK